MIGFRHRGDFSKAEKYLKDKRTKVHRIAIMLDKYGKEGVAALESATPVDTGLTARSWYYKIDIKPTFARLLFCNSNIQNGIPIALILQYGHGTGTGGWVEGRDYINPALQPIFDELSKNAREEVTKL